MADPRADFIADITEPIFLAVGEASACWENLSGAGVFDDSHAAAVANGLVARITEAFDEHAEAAS
jgi:hypothetical protein